MAAKEGIIEEMDGIIREALEHPLEKEETALSILELAIRIESLTKMYYSYLAKKVANKAGKSTLEFLADEEVENLKTLKTQYQALKKDENWLLREHVEPAKSICPLVMPSEQGIKKAEDIIPKEKVSREESDLEALRLAMEVKERTLRFYCAAASKVKDPAGKKMFSHLIEMESKHLKELEVQHAWLKQAGFWFDASMMTD